MVCILIDQASRKEILPVQSGSLVTCNRRCRPPSRVEGTYRRALGWRWSCFWGQFLIFAAWFASCCTGGRHTSMRYSLESYPFSSIPLTINLTSPINLISIIIKQHYYKLERTLILHEHHSLNYFIHHFLVFNLFLCLLLSCWLLGRYMFWWFGFFTKMLRLRGCFFYFLWFLLLKCSGFTFLQHLLSYMVGTLCSFFQVLEATVLLHLPNWTLMPFLAWLLLVE